MTHLIIHNFRFVMFTLFLGVLETFDALVSQTKEKTAAILHEVTWFGMKIPIRIERVRLFLLSIEGSIHSF